MEETTQAQLEVTPYLSQNFPFFSNGAISRGSFCRTASTKRMERSTAQRHLITDLEREDFSIVLSSPTKPRDWMIWHPTFPSKDKVSIIEIKARNHRKTKKTELTLLPTRNSEEPFIVLRAPSRINALQPLRTLRYAKKKTTLLLNTSIQISSRLNGRCG